eukprot:4217399-Alexandrium_andersonii.AAC.1
MSASLVGSEMCIRDRQAPPARRKLQKAVPSCREGGPPQKAPRAHRRRFLHLLSAGCDCPPPPKAASARAGGTFGCVWAG